jgi:hypothetical protein
VTIGLGNGDETEGTVAPSSIVFTTDDWNNPRTVTVTGADDTEADGDQSYFVVTAPASSADANYDGIDPADPGVVNIDDEDESDTDGDGVGNDVEDRATPFAGGKQGDGNGDDEFDRDQSDVSSIPDADGETMITVENKNGKTMRSATALPRESAPADSDGFVPNFPKGMIGFEIGDVSSGQIVEMRVCMDRDESVESYWKMNRETGKWTDIAESVRHVGNKTVVVFSIAEGGPYDTDDNPNAIADPGGPGFGAAEADAIPSVNAWGLLALALCMTAALPLIRKRKA